MTGMKLTNCYSEAVGEDVYVKAPKAGFAAVAVSRLTCGGDHLNLARKLFLAEWQALYEGGIVTQRPPKAFDATGALAAEIAGELNF